MSVCRSVCLSARNEFYRSVMLLLVYLCCSFDCQNILLSYLVLLAVIAAKRVTMSISINLDTSFNVVISELYVAMINVTDDLDVVFAT